MLALDCVSSAQHRGQGSDSSRKLPPSSVQRGSACLPHQSDAQRRSPEPPGLVAKLSVPVGARLRAIPLWREVPVSGVAERGAKQLSHCLAQAVRAGGAALRAPWSVAEGCCWPLSPDAARCPARRASVSRHGTDVRHNAHTTKANQKVQLTQHCAVSACLQCG